MKLPETKFEEYLFKTRGMKALDRHEDQATHEPAFLNKRSRCRKSTPQLAKLYDLFQRDTVFLDIEIAERFISENKYDLPDQCQAILVQAVPWFALLFLVQHGIDPSEQVQLLAVESNPFSILHLTSPSEKVQFASLHYSFGKSFKDIKCPSDKVREAFCRMFPGVIFENMFLK